MNGTFARVPIAGIEVKHQLRTTIDAERLQQFAGSIHTHGQQRPILCRSTDGKLELIDGWRCLEALKQLGEDEVDVLIIEEDVSDGEAFARRLICNIHQEGLSAIDRAKGLREFMDLGALSAAEAAERLSLSPASICRDMRLLSLPEELQLLVASGEIPASAAYELSKVEDPEEQAALAGRVVLGTLNRDELAHEVRRSSPRKNPGARSVTRVTAVLGEGRSVTIAGKELNLDLMIEWLEPLVTRAKKARAQGITLETFVRTLRDQAQHGEAA